MCASEAAAPRFELPRTRRALPRTRTNGENTTRQPVYPGADPYLRHFSARSRVTVLRATRPRNLSPCDNNTPQTTPPPNPHLHNPLPRTRRRNRTHPFRTLRTPQIPRARPRPHPRAGAALSELSPKRGNSGRFDPVFRVFGDSSDEIHVTRRVRGAPGGFGVSATGGFW